MAPFRRTVSTGSSEAVAADGAPTVITAYRDGPLLVRGPVELRDQDGRESAVGREVVALCRCGRSRERPFCDGTHLLTRFRAPSGRESR
ncbi:MAG TPA: CDGSH iron-sulfur domain-containing protein [Solirubrobacteraceae bacterium]|nr:CDGSH iron-sulfur domain-containing protein [Solirubrobacteraceae bacterium]